MVFNRPPSDVSLDDGARKSAAVDDNDVFGRDNSLMNIAARVELFRPRNYLLLELLGAHVALLRSLDKQGRRRPAVPNNDTLENELTTCGAHVVLY